MNIALWIIAICEILRMVQNCFQIAMARHDIKGRDNAYAEFISSLKQDDRQFVRRMLEEFERQENDGR